MPRLFPFLLLAFLPACSPAARLDYESRCGQDREGGAWTFGDGAASLDGDTMTVTLKREFWGFAIRTAELKFGWPPPPGNCEALEAMTVAAGQRRDELLSGTLRVTDFRDGTLYAEIEALLQSKRPDRFTQVRGRFRASLSVVP